MNDDYVLDLAPSVLLWVSSQALEIGTQTLNSIYGTLGCGLFILALHVPAIIDDEDVTAKLVKVLELLNKACSVSHFLLIDTPVSHSLDDFELTSGTKNQMTTVSENESDKFSTLRKIQWYTPETVDEEVRFSLSHFVQAEPEFNIMLRLVQECSLGLNQPVLSLSAETHSSETDEMEYPAYMNDTLYEQLRINACCKCKTGHLEWTQLRLDTKNKRIDADVTFELLFNPSSRPPLRLALHENNYIRWKEAIVSVSTRRDSQRKVAFIGQPSESSESLSSSTRISSKARHLRSGEFCKIISSQINNRFYFHMQADIMNVVDKREMEGNRILPEVGISLGDWLLKTPHLSNKGKVSLAYILAKSAWQYYDSLWMMTPWTHDIVRLLSETSLTTERGRPHPYLRRQLINVIERRKDVYVADDLMYRFPHILALAILLIEIAIKQPFREEHSEYIWSEATINDYYQWALNATYTFNLKQSIHTIYEEVVKNCLTPDLFETSSLQESDHEDGPKIRKRLLYERIVSPLKKLYEAYQDDWEFESVPVALPSAITNAYSHSAENPIPFQALRRDQFTVAILCALPLEVDAVTSLFDEFWDENVELLRDTPDDSNAYTIGSMGGHMVVVVHMPGMGTIAASQSASSLRSTFPNIKLALLVGICGSIPHYGGEHEIILGDVVISEGIVQYDFGRLLPGGTFYRKTSMPEILGRPNAAIRGLLAKMKTKNTKETLKGKIVDYLQIINDNLGGESAQYPGTSQDELFRSDYIHKHYDPGAYSTSNHFIDSRGILCNHVSNSTCEQISCQKENLIARDRIKLAAKMGRMPTPMVHIGLFGSGDTVMKSGMDRDRIASRDNVIAFEMEGAGVWDVLPCIVIKGVSDYADSHKNKVWQGYAAATGAACMRAVLELWTH